MFHIRSWRISVPKRLLALVLSTCMVLSLSRPMTTMVANAVDAKIHKDTVIAGFEPLPDEVRTQQVILGTSSVALTLPDTLQATAAIGGLLPPGTSYPLVNSLPTSTPAESSSSTESSTPADSSSSIESSTPADSSSSTESSTPADSSSSTESSTSADSSSSAESSTPADSSSSTASSTPAESSSSTASSTPAESSSSTASSTPAESSSSTESSTPAESSSSTASGTPAESGSSIESSTPAGESSGNGEAVAQGTNQYVNSDMLVIIEGVTWESAPAYDGNTEGSYIFTAVLPDGYTVEEGVSLPTITVTVGKHILEYGDCMDLDCPTHYPPEILALMAEDETPELLTLDDLVEDYGVERPAPSKGRSASNPQTLMLTNDNENNAYTGTPDGDLDLVMGFRDKNAPIEIRFELDSPPVQNAYIAIKAFDIDEEDGEDDHVFVNGKEVGCLSGTNVTWNATVLEIPIEELKAGSNYIRIQLSEDLFAFAFPRWSAKVDWMQLVLDGGKKDTNIDSFDIKLGEPTDDGTDVQVPATVTIAQKGNTQYITEYTLMQIKNGFALDAQFGTAQEQESVTLSLPKNSETGEYKVVGILKDPATEEIKASDEAKFTFKQGVGAVLIPLMQHTLTPSRLTKSDVVINVSTKDADICTDIEIVGGSSQTATTNGDQSFTIKYKRRGVDYSFVYVVPVTNIDKTPPIISYVPISVVEDTPNSDIQPLMKAALTATDDREITESPSFTLPANLASGFGNKTVTVSVKDVAGNVTTQNCNITVTALPLKLTHSGTPTRVDGANSFNLSATLVCTGNDTITETGFVWGTMQSPTLSINNGKANTATPVTAKGGTIAVTATGIVDGVTFYARPYATISGKTFYGDQKSFSIGGKSYGSFSIANNGDNTFTVTRSEGSDGIQYLYYRTVNGSAVHYVHFNLAVDCLTFAQGETSKIITILGENPNAASTGKAATAYSNAQRTYQVELYNVTGGATINSAASRATRTMAAGKGIDRSLYTTEKSQTETSTADKGWFIRDNSDNGPTLNNARGGTINQSFNFYPRSMFTGDEAVYLTGTGASYGYRYNLIQFLENTDGWEHTWVGLAKAVGDNVDQGNQGDPIPLDSSAGKAIYTASFELWAGSGANNFKFPQNGQEKKITAGGTVGIPYKTLAGDNRMVQPYGSDYYLNMSDSETAFVHFGCCGSGKESWYLKGISHYAIPMDFKEPQVIGIATMAGGRYKQGDPFTLSLIFDEIVDAANSPDIGSVSINTNCGVMTYGGGVGTNVLYFNGTVPTDATGNSNASLPITVTGINNAGNIRDMCSQAGTVSGGSGSASIDADFTTPTVSIANGGITNGTATGTITSTNADLKYAWTQSASMPANGWMSCSTETYVAKTRQTSGMWYLHALATYSPTGKTAHASTPFDFGTASPLPSLTVSADNTNWAHTRDISVTRTPANATVTYTGPESDTASGGTVNVATNGLYTFTLTLGDETITQQVSVSKLDAVAPIVAIKESGNTSAVYNALNFGATVIDTLSGLKTVEYSWSNTTSPGAWTTASGSGGSYTMSYTATEAAKTIKYLHIRATDNAGNVATKVSSGYTVVKPPTSAEMPAITLTGAPTSWTKGSVNLTWNVTKQGAGGISVNVDGTVSTATTGTISATGNGLYSAMVTDQNGNTASAELLVDKIDTLAPILTGLSVKDGTPGGVTTKDKTIVLAGVNDNRTPIPDATGTITGYGGSSVQTQAWKLGSGSYTTFTGTTFTAAANGTYTVQLTDVVGNQNEYTIAISGVDKTAPAVTVGTPASGWTDTAQSITVSYSDGDSGIATAKYAITTSNTGTPTTLLDLPASGQSVTVGSGKQYIYYKVTDKAGNETTGYSGLIQVDTDSPTINVTGNPAAWQNTDVTLTLAVTAGASGYKVTKQEGSGAAADFTGTTYTVSENGSVTFAVTSGTGKTATQTVVVDKIDKTVPTVTVGTPEPGWTGTAQNIPVTYNDEGGSGFGTTQYAITTTNTGAKPTSLTNLPASGQSVAVSSSGKQYIYYKVIDNAGNATDGYSGEIKIDTTAPVIGELTYSESPKNLWDWIIGKTKMAITVPVTETESGASVIDYTMNPDGVTPESKTAKIENGNATITFDKEYKGTIEISCTDAVGNVSSTVKAGTNGVIVEDTAPTVTIGSPDVAANGDGWRNAVFDLPVNVTDDGISGGLALIEWQLDSGAVNSVTDTFATTLTTSFDFTISGTTEGTHTIQVRATDTAGNTSAWSSLDYKLDTTKPTCTGLSYASGWTNQDLEVTVPCTDAGSGIKSVVVTGATSGAMTVDSSYKFTAGQNDTYTVTITDNADNVYEFIEEITCIDKATPAAPTVAITGGTEGTDDWYNTSVTYTVTRGDASDLPSGTTKFAYSTDDGKTWSDWNDFSGGGNFTIHTSGVYDKSIVVKTKSGAGTESAVSTQYSLKLDTTQPTLTVTGGEAGAETFDFAVNPPGFGVSSGTVTVAKDGGAAQTVTDGKVAITESGSYLFTATSGAGNAATVTKQVYKASFDSKGGSAVTAQLVVEGGKVTLPTVPTKSGFVFTEWNETGQTSAYDFGTAVASNKALEAVWTLDAPTVTLRADNETATYNAGVAATLAVTVEHGFADAAFTYEWYKDGNKVDGKTENKLELGTVADSGSYTVKVTASGDSMTSSETTTAVSVAIAQAPVTFAVTDNELDYTGAAQVATVKQTDAETPDVTGKFTVSYQQSGTVIAPTIVGDYDVMVELTDPNFRHKDELDGTVRKLKVGTLTIKPTDYQGADDIEWPTAGDLTYGETLADSALTGGSEIGKGSYSWKDGTTVPTVTNSGYTVVFTPSDTNYAPFEKTVAITVAKATSTLTLPTAGGVIYGDTLAKSTITGGSAAAVVSGGDVNVPGVYSWTTPTTLPLVSDSDLTEYDITFTPTDTANYNVVTTGKIKLSVERRTAELSWSGHTDLVYTSKPVDVTAAVTNLVGSDSCAVTVTGGTETDSGSYTAEATAVGNDNYKLPTDVEQGYTIAKAPVTFAVTDNVHDYNGDPKTATVKQTDGQTPDVSGNFTISYQQDSSTIDQPTNVGEYDVMVTLTDNANFMHNGLADNVTKQKVGTLTIKGIPYPAADTMQWPTAGNLTYGETLADSALTGGSETAKGTYSWEKPTTVPTATNSGYTVVFTPNDTNYPPFSKTVAITVAKETSTLTLPTAGGITYGDTLAKSTITGGSASAVVSGVDKDIPGVYSWTTPTTLPHVSDSDKTEYSVTFTPTDTDNYNVTTGKVKLNVEQRTAALKWSGHTDLVYTAKPVDVTAEVTNLVGSDSCTVTVTGGTETDSGSYTAEATTLGNDNYKLPTNVEQSYTIAQAPITFEVTDNQYDYDGDPKTATVTQTVGQLPDVTGSFTVSYEKDSNTVANPTNVGEYDIMVELTDPSLSHKDNVDTLRKLKVGTLTIKAVPYPGADTIEWSTAEDITYGETLADSALTGGSERSKGTYSWKDPTTVPTVTNNGYVVVFTPDDTNYLPFEKTVEITVDKETSTLTLPTAGGIIYGDTLAKSTITGGSASAVVSGEDKDVPGVYSWTTPTTLPHVSDSDTTEYSVTFTPTDTDNYNVTTGKVKLNVEQRTADLKWSGHTDLVYTAKPVDVTATVTNLVGSDSCTVTVTGGTETDSGSYTAEATTLGNDNYKLPTNVEQSYTIAQAPITFAVTDNLYDYDGDPKTATVKQTDGQTPDVAGRFTVSYEQDGNTVDKPTNVGAYDIMVELTDPSLSHKDNVDTLRKLKVGTLTIKAVPYPGADDIEWSTAEDITYGETLADSALTGGSETSKGTYSWKDPTTVPTVNNNGYVVVFTPDDTNYLPFEKTVEITVDKETSTLTLPTAGGITYGDTLSKSTITGGSASAVVSGKAKDIPGIYEWTTPTTLPQFSDSDTTEYSVTFTPTDTDNYSVTTGKVKVTVQQRTAELKWSGQTDLVYTAKPVNVTAAVTNLVGSDSCAVTVDDGAKTDAGSYTAKATALGNDNYKLPTAAEQSYTIAQRQIRAIWSELFPAYDGSEKKPTVALDGVLDSEDCTAVSTGSGPEGNAGRYKVTASLQGNRSSNYSIDKSSENEIMVVQPARVSVRLSDYSHKYDGNPKRAIVTANPDIPLNVVYKLAGTDVAVPIEEGIYDIFVKLDDSNYRFADGVDGKSRRMGALTIYKEKPPEIYTVTFEPGAEDAVGTAPTLPPSVRGTTHTLPSSTFLRVGYAFVGWKNGNNIYQPGDRFNQPANDTTVFTAQWESATFDIGGVVDQEGKPASNVRVVLMRGSEQVAETVTNQIGEYRFADVLPGLYNLVAIKPSPDGVGDIIMTIKAEVKETDVEQANITMPSGKTNSVVEVAPGTPKIIVGNLDKTFTSTGGEEYTEDDKQVVKAGGTVEIKFTAEEKQKSELGAETEMIAREAGGAKVELYLSLGIAKTVTHPSTEGAPPVLDTTDIRETSILLESIIPLPKNMHGKYKYVIYRMHDGVVDTITTEEKDGEHIVVNDARTALTLYASKYSTYAVAYMNKPSDDDDDNTQEVPKPLLPEVIEKPVAQPPTVIPPKQEETVKTDDKVDDKADNKPTDNSKPTAPPAANDFQKQKDEILNALEDAINSLPDTLTDQERQAYIDRLTEMSNAAIAALDAIADPASADQAEANRIEADRIVEQLRSDLADLVAEAVAGTQADKPKPFVVASALLALAAVVLAVLSLRVRRRAVVALVCAVLTVITFLLTTGWNGFALANWWTLPIAALTCVTALCVMGKTSQKEDEEAAK